MHKYFNTLKIYLCKSSAHIIAVCECIFRSINKEWYYKHTSFLMNQFMITYTKIYKKHHRTFFFLMLHEKNFILETAL